MLADLRQSIADWIFRPAVPEVPPVTLVQRRIFILPTRQGYGFGLMIVLLLVASINYSLSLGFVLTFLLASMAGVAMLHTWRNLAHLRLRPGRCDAVFAGDIAHFGVTLESPALERFAIGLRRRGDEPIHADIGVGEPVTLAVPLRTRRRGLARCGRLEVFTRYPLGLFHAWSYVEFDLAVVVYPKPDENAGAPPGATGDASEEGIPVPGDEEFNMLRAYRPGDAPRQIAWKALARERGLLTKEFSATASSELWLDWDDARARDAEARLSILAQWVLHAEEFGRAYGLRLPGVSVAPGRGEAHRARCLEALALFEAPR
ncbi:MAG TPA: DUF58 domain-containing protein [Usitatibacter sp.]|nr:DUF58 domain-containing protein [Usitatibacter sp.]